MVALYEEQEAKHQQAQQMLPGTATERQVQFRMHMSKALRSKQEGMAVPEVMRQAAHAWRLTGVAAKPQTEVAQDKVEPVPDQAGPAGVAAEPQQESAQDEVESLPDLDV